MEPRPKAASSDRRPDVSIVIPVLNKLEFTRQCLERIWRNTDGETSYEVIVVDNGSTDETAEWFAGLTPPRPLRYQQNQQNLGYAKANNIGARISRGDHLLFLNNDTLVQPNWLTEMLRVIRSDPSVGIVGIKQLFPYTNVIYHTGIVFAPGGIPQHLYPHLDASLPQVNKEREYQAVTGACLLIARSEFEGCGGFDEAYVNGYEDVDLCMRVRRRGRKIVCCTSAYIYHYGQISEGRTADDDRNAARFATLWSERIRIDQAEYVSRDQADAPRQPSPLPSATRRLGEDEFYLADDLGQGSALTWINAELALSLKQLGRGVFVNGSQLSPTLPPSIRERLRPLAIAEKPVGGVQIKWSHYWPQHLNLELTGDLNFEFFVINYCFGRPGFEPWDYWLQCVRQNHHVKLPLSEFCASVLRQLGISPGDCHVLNPGYSREVHDVEQPARRDSRFRFLTVTNSHDLGRYNTLSVLEAYDKAFGSRDDVSLVVKDYGASSGDTTIRESLEKRRERAHVEYIGQFTEKRELIRLYKSTDAFVSAHRGEGYGMKILDAMACGLPVVTPTFGGPATFCAPGTIFPVDFSLVPVGDSLDTRSLAIANQPLWAEADVHSLATRMREVYDERARARTVGERGRAAVVDRLSWDRAARRLADLADELRTARNVARPGVDAPPLKTERSPYWLGLRVSVLVPTHNRKEKLLECLGCLARQSVLPQEFEVIVVDDGSTDGTGAALSECRFPFRLRYYRKEHLGPGAARNFGIAQAAGELVLFIGDDILADEHLLEEHLLAHAAGQEPGLAVLGHIDWPDTMAPNAVMRYVCGDADLQFAYARIPHLSSLDHRFFYTSNISLKRRFLVDAAASGITFDPCFRHAAFEDSEFAYRLLPRGLRIRYVAGARAFHDHWMDLGSFAAREFRAGQMAVIFYRKHPSEDDQLQVRWVEDLAVRARTLMNRGDAMSHLENFDRQTDALLMALAGSLEALMAMDPVVEADRSTGSSLERIRTALNNVFRVIFDVQRTRGKVDEWFDGVDDRDSINAAQTLAAVHRKIEFLTLNADHIGRLQGTIQWLDGQVVASLRGRIAELEGRASERGVRVIRRHVKGVLRRLVTNPRIMSRLMTADRFVQRRLQTSERQRWLKGYRRVRSKFRHLLA